MMVFIALLIPTLLGLLTISVLLKDDPGAGFLERICLAYPIGTGMLTLQMFILGLFKLPLTLTVTSLPVILEIAGLAYWLRTKRISILPRPTFGLWREITSSNSSWVSRGALALLAIWAGAKLGSVFLETYLRPIYAWDAWSNWSVTAKLFYYEKGMLLNEPTEYFFGRGVANRLVGYPLHNPLMQVWLSQWVGRFDDVLVKFWTPAYLLCTSLYLYRVAERETNRLAGLAVLIIFLSSPLMSYHAVEVYSDFTLGAYFFLILAAFLEAQRGKQPYWAIAGIFTTEALFVKDEAVVFAFLFLLSASVFIWKNIPVANKRTFAASLFLPLMAVAPWFVFKALYTPTLGVVSSATSFVFHPENIVLAFQSVLSLQNFNIILAAFPILLAVSGRLQRDFHHLSFIVICYLLFFLCLYVVVPDYHTHFNRGTIFYRNVLTAYPALCLLTVMLLRNTIRAEKTNEPIQSRRRRK